MPSMADFENATPAAPAAPAPAEPVDDVEEIDEDADEEEPEEDEGDESDASEGGDEEAEESDEEAEDDEEPAPAPKKKASKSADDAEETEPTGKARKLDPERIYRVGEQKIKGEELSKGYMRQADYTKKTTAAAESVKAATTRAETAEENTAEWVDWFEGLKDPDTMQVNLEMRFPEQYATLRDRILQEALDEVDMSDRERELHSANRKTQLSQRMQKHIDGLKANKEGRKAKAQSTATRIAEFNKWTDEVCKEAGLDLEKTSHKDLFRGRMSLNPANVPWTREMFAAAAKAVADALGIKTPPLGKKKTPQAEPEKKSKLPPAPVKGAKRPPADDRPKKSTKPAPSRNPFEDIRAKYGV